MPKEQIFTSKAPKPFGAYSQAIKVGNTVYLAGQIPYNAATGKVVTDSIEAQAVQAFENLKAVAEAAGGTLNDLVKVNIFITDFKLFPAVDSVMKRYFNEPYPARATVGTSLGMGVDVEVEGIMVLGASSKY